MVDVEMNLPTTAAIAIQMDGWNLEPELLNPALPDQWSSFYFNQQAYQSSLFT